MGSGGCFPSLGAPCDQQLAVPLQPLLGIPRAQWWDKGSQKGKQWSGLQGLSGTHSTAHEASHHSRAVAITESQYCLLHTSYSRPCGRTCRLAVNDIKKLPQHSRQLKANFFTVLHLFKTFSIFAAHFSSRASSSTLLKHKLFLLTCIHPEYLFHHPLSSDLLLSF